MTPYDKMLSTFHVMNNGAVSETIPPSEFIDSIAKFERAFEEWRRGVIQAQAKRVPDVEKRISYKPHIDQLFDAMREFGTSTLRAGYSVKMWEEAREQLRSKFVEFGIADVFNWLAKD